MELKETYIPLKNLADEVERVRLELFNNKIHREHVVREYLDSVKIFNEIDDELFMIYSKLTKIYYYMVGEGSEYDYTI